MEKRQDRQPIQDLEEEVHARPGQPPALERRSLSVSLNKRLLAEACRIGSARTEVRSPFDSCGPWPRPYKSKEVTMTANLMIRVDVADIILAAAVLAHALR